MRKISLMSVLLLIPILSIGCLQKSRVADLTVMSSKNISTLVGAKRMGVFEGKDCRSAFSGGMPNQEEALDRALEAGGGNAMIDAVIYFKPANCIFDNICWEVKGTVIKTKDMLTESSSKNILDEYYNIDKGYAREHFTTDNGHKYVLVKRALSVELDNDKRHYECILRVK